MDNLPAERQEAVTLTEKDIKAYIAPNATDKELFMFLNICKSYNLSPIKREVHFIKYGTAPGHTVVGYEVYLKRAEATGKLNGWKAWVEGDKAKCIIYRKDWTNPFEWEIDINEFNKHQSTWNVMPNFMAKKVVTCQAFRLCFPVEMGGMPYIQEEIVIDVKPEETVVVPPPQEKKVDYKSKLKEIQSVIADIAKGRNMTPSAVVAELGFKKTSEIPVDQYDAVRAKLTDMLNNLIKQELDAKDVTDGVETD